MRRPQPIPDRPTQPLIAWMEHLLKDTEAKTEVIHFGTLGDLTRKEGYLEQLCKVVGATPTDTTTVLAGYKFLQKSVRNRDAHAYVPNVRDAQFELVQKLFVNSFNLLLSWLPENPTGPNE